MRTLMYTWCRFADGRAGDLPPAQGTASPASRERLGPLPPSPRVCLVVCPVRCVSGFFHQHCACNRCPCHCAHLQAIHAHHFCPAVAGSMLCVAQVTGVGQRPGEGHHREATVALWRTGGGTGGSLGGGRRRVRHVYSRRRRTEPDFVPFSLPSAFVLRGDMTLNKMWCPFRFVLPPPHTVTLSLSSSPS